MRRSLTVLVIAALATAALVGVRSTMTKEPPRARDVAQVAGVTDDATCRGDEVRPGDDVHAAIDRVEGGETLCFAPGVHRLARPVIPKDGQRLLAMPGAVLSGARVVGRWKRTDGLWSAQDILPDTPTPHGQCVEGTLCRFRETVFVDGRPLERARSRADVEAGSFWADYRDNTVWIADDPANATVEVARASGAIVGEAASVTVHGFQIEKFANPAQRGAIHAEGREWTIEHNDVLLNHGTGVHADGGRVANNHIHHNGQLGVLGTGDGLVVEGNEIDHNNTRGFSDLWEAGGTKFAFTDHLVVRGNDVHHNVGPGLWTDINNSRTIIEYNVVRNNRSHGIFHEISYSADIRYNRVISNGDAQPLQGWGGAGIRIAASSDVAVHGNVLVDNQNAIILVQQVRDDWPSELGPHLIRNVSVYGNDITLGHRAVTGLVDDTGRGRSYNRDVRFDDNTYRLSRLDADAFTWRGDVWDRVAWMQRFGQDETSTYVTS